MSESIFVIPSEKDNFKVGGIAFVGVPLVDSLLLCFAYNQSDRGPEWHCEIHLGLVDQLGLKKKSEHLGERLSARDIRDAPAVQRPSYVIEGREIRPQLTSSVLISNERENWIKATLSGMCRMARLC